MKMIFKLTHMKVGKLVFAILNSVQVQIIPLHQGILLMKYQTLTFFLANSCNGRFTYLFCYIMPSNGTTLKSNCAR